MKYFAPVRKLPYKTNHNQKNGVRGSWWFCEQRPWRSHGLRPPFLLESWAHWSGPLPSPRGAGEIWPNLTCGIPFLDPMKCTHAACINPFHTGGRDLRVWHIQTCPVLRAVSADTWVHRYALVLLAEPSGSNVHALTSISQTAPSLLPTISGLGCH